MTRTIDERLDAITETLELVAGMQKASEERIDKLRAEQERLDKRERQARGALLSGIAAYLQALDSEDGEQ